HLPPAGQGGFNVTIAAGTVTWTGAGNKSFPKNSTVTFTLVVKVDCTVADGATINNTATVTIIPSDTDPIPGNNSQPASTAVTHTAPSISCPAPVTVQCA